MRLVLFRDFMRFCGAFRSGRQMDFQRAWLLWKKMCKTIPGG